MVMYSYLFFLSFIQPLLEYIFHRKVHINQKYDLFQIHKAHHIDIHQKKYDHSLLNNMNYAVCLAPLYFLSYGEYAWLGIMKYQLGHYMLHRYPYIYPELTKFHMVHHQNPKVNYTVTAMWPDKVFGTYSKKLN